jgi:alpha-glucosidase
MPWEKDAPNAGFSTGKPWLPVPEAHRRSAVDAEQGEAGSLLEHYRRFLAFRRGHPALAKGDIDFLAADDHVIVFVRESDDEQVICAFNLGPRPAELDLGAETGLETIDGHGFDGTANGGKIRLGGYGAWFGRMA